MPSKYLGTPLDILSDKRISETGESYGSAVRWFTMDSHHFSDDEDDPIRYSNFEAFIEELPTTSWSWDNFDLVVAVAHRSAGGEWVYKTRAIDYIYSVEGALEDYCILSDEKHTAIEVRTRADSQYEVTRELVNLLTNEFEWSVVLAEAWINAHATEIFEDSYERAIGGHYEKAVVVCKLKEHDLFLMAMDWTTLPGYTIHRSIHSDKDIELWLVRPTLLGGLNPLRLSGVLATYQRIEASEGKVHVEIMTNLRSSEFGGNDVRGYVPTVAWEKLPAVVRYSVFKFLLDPQEELDLWAYSAT